MPVNWSVTFNVFLFVVQCVAILWEVYGLFFLVYYLCFRRVHGEQERSVDTRTDKCAQGVKQQGVLNVLWRC